MSWPRCLWPPLLALLGVALIIGCRGEPAKPKAASPKETKNVAQEKKETPTPPKETAEAKEQTPKEPAAAKLVSLQVKGMV